MASRLKKISDWAGALALAGGAAFFVWLVYKIGPDTLRQTFHGRTPAVLGICLVYGLFQAAYCWGWRCTLVPLRVSFGRLFAVYLAGDTASYAIPLAGEPLKAKLLRPAYPTTEGLYSVSVAKFCEFVAQLLFYAVGLTLALFAFPLSLRVRAAGLAAAGGLALGLGVLFWRQRKGLYGPVLDLWEKIVRREIAPETRVKVEELDRRIALFYAESPKAFFLCLLGKFIGKLGGAVEAALVLLFLGRTPTLASAFAIETLTMIANDAVFFIPGRVGGAEGGRVLVFLMLGFTAAEGLTYAVVRRIRELFWVGAGLAYLIVVRARRPKKLKAVLFDFDGTLDSRGLSRQDRLFGLLDQEGVRCERAAFDRAWRRVRTRLRARPEAAKQGLRETLQAEVDALFDELGLGADARRSRLVDGLLEPALERLALSRELLLQLKTRYRLGILDNGYGNLGRVCLDLGLTEAVDLVVDSGQVGFEKPDPEIFEYALKKLGLEPGEALYVGDSLACDMAGAQLAGLRHVWLASPGAEGRLCCLEDRSVGALEELKGLLLEGK